MQEMSGPGIWDYGMEIQMAVLKKDTVESQQG
jgi:hypothetical protein